MSCFHPIKAWRAPPGHEGRSAAQILFSDPLDSRCQEITLPCGQCIGCREAKSKEWAIRCLHEASLHDENCFLTLTYNENPYSLNVEDIQLFMKRLRWSIAPKKVRFFQCGEYGTLNGRPHHHVLLFGYDFPDKKFLTHSVGGDIYVSERLADLWPHGFVSIGDVSFESAAYVARYVMKKVNGDIADEHYQGRKPEYITMSRRPGIAADWIKRYSGDVYPKDYITYQSGLKVKPPRYYDKFFDLHHHDQMSDIVQSRVDRAQLRVSQGEYSPERLAVKKELKRLKLEKLERSFEVG